MTRRLKTTLVSVAMSVLVLGGAVVPAAAWVSPGSNVAYPVEGGRWTYGFWDAALRSEYIVDQCHGTTVHRLIDGEVVDTDRSIDTQAGEVAGARIWTYNSPGLGARYFYRTC